MSVSVGVISGSTSPYSAKVSATGGGGGGVAAVAKATITAVLAQGPLRTMFENATTGAAFQALRNDPRLSVIAYVRDPSGACTVPALFDLNTTSFLFGIAGDFEAIFELRFNHTIDR